ncbi:transcriptional regulator [Latilactobacillus curvatus]|uniref:Transcriptional regulator n=1 Tax=Latilactobacillus curvatus TaxID=28038 RepID=A0AAC9UR96_LATCU|nr:effector binding domain-containing protein [Latilactobacillus curvatus]ASN60112.1 transcriptional regulator [Latilactobacillus curvatus]MDG2978510.1 transcriptional regulator [Latilactobacillus curvatus]
MKFTILDTERTNNFNDVDVQSKIANLWTRNMPAIKEASAQGLVIACIYHNYASDYKGDYSVSLCVEDDNGVFDTSSTTWQEYTVKPNNQDGIFRTWQTIWSAEERNTLNRIYTFDFERYSPDGTISILIAV